MLDVSSSINGKKAIIKVEGRADTPSSEKVYDELEKAIENGCIEFEFDLSEVEYVCSATLRAFLKAQKLCNRDGYSMYITGASEGVKDVFEITGFTSMIDIM